ncbi:MAG: adenosylcobinamide-phosphate synthase CbiB [Cyanobacteria bacterium]|nr:adenosylcobinamide-phosphate synthase CbiB [Cyanobacteriota bacterium]
MDQLASPPNRWIPLIVLPLAAVLDWRIGDPWTWPHPVQGIGAAINFYVRLCLGPGRDRRRSPAVELALGVGLLILALGLSGAIAGLWVWLWRSLHPWLGIVAEAIAIAAGFAGRSLRDAAMDVLAPLTAPEKDVAMARSHLSRYVGRDTAHLDETEILRAIAETVAENSVDGVLAPLFWTLIGAAIWPVGGGAIALWIYKAASTLDSTVGYRRAPYLYLGRASARTEDVLTWVPCRLSVAAIALLSGQPREVITLCRRDAIADPSPNSGWSECAYAAALGIQLGGDNYYGGQLIPKPRLGEATRSPSAAVILEALALTRSAFLSGLGLGLLGLAGRCAIAVGTPWG